MREIVSYHTKQKFKGSKFMTIRTESKYTKERLIKFNNYVALSKKGLWIIMVASALLVLGCVIFQALNGGVTEPVKISMWFILFLIAFYSFISFILPHLTLTKSKTLNAEITCIFNENSFDLHVKNDNFDEKSTVRYLTLTKIVKNQKDIYLFIASNQAFITSLNGLSEDEISELKLILGNAINKKNFKWR